MFSRPILLIWLLSAAIFLLDVLIPQQGNVALLYLLPVLLGLLLKEKNDIVLLGLIATVLSVAPVFLQNNELPVQVRFFDRIISVLGIWAAGYLVLRIKYLKDDESTRSEQFRALFEHASIGIVVVNNRGEIVRVNPFIEQLFGYTAHELEGESVELLIPKRLHSIHRNHREEYKSGPTPRTMGTGLNLSAVRKDGNEFPVEVSLSPFRTTSGSYVMAFLLDNSIRKDHENRILRQNLRLEQLAAALQNLNEGLEEKVRERTNALEQAKNDLAAALDKERELGELKSRFVSMASHEFRTPLSTVLSSASLIQTYNQKNDPENIHKHAGKIKTAVNNLNTILTEFLSLGKLEEGKTQPNRQEINLPVLIGEVADELRGVFKPGQTFEPRHTGHPSVLLDPGLLKHVLINLVSNAVKYAPENSPITVQSEVSNGRVCISVQDRGMGIPDSDKKHLFSRFFRASNASNIQGTGLGLYIVHRYVELMNGEITFESEEGKGTTFHVSFDAAGAHA